MKILVDMNLSPAWIDVLKSAGLEATHWSTVGAPGAPDREIMLWLGSMAAWYLRMIWISERFSLQLKRRRPAYCNCARQTYYRGQ